ncbi:hypothetical protein BV25DRAFT_1919030 [Artomyces pyxidatus]|uniref:Uncharacterized protein n=1 Tax=Artomyces pyxidatus TaxID=48021 RepID=A0ACB8SRY4_9AGAM|nr:hypothetical protein BV25DRAFT_1919030 [Artomyces pyxidatus]
MAPPPPRTIPKRSDSINAVKNAQFFTSIDEELRDSKRVQRQGQEEDLREALSRIMLRVEELCALLKSSYQANAELETNLTLAQSNLKLALANNEMLEDALKQNSTAKDVGWRRSSRDTTNMPAPSPVPTPRESFDESEERNHVHAAPKADSAPPSNVGSPVVQQDSRFFRFGFSSGRSTPTQSHSPAPGQKSVLNGVRASMPAGGTSHLTSASLPSLIAPLDSQRELEELRASLDAEKRKREKIAGEKESLEGELESLSQALFEEANKMVALERIKRAEAEEELRETRLEKDALRSALRLIEDERMRTSIALEQQTESNTRYMENHPATASSHKRSSSQIALKSPISTKADSEDDLHSPSSSAMSPQTTPTLAITVSDDDPSDDDPNHRTPPPASPAPLYVPPPHNTNTSQPRTTSPSPLPHPLRPSHLRTQTETRKPPAPPPPSAADGFADSPWSVRTESGDGSTLTHSVPFTPPLPDELASPWGDR